MHIRGAVENIDVKTSNGYSTREMKSDIPEIELHDLIYIPEPYHNTSPIVNEEYKVIFFHVAKVASTEFKRFFARLEGSPQWCAGNQGKNIHRPEVNKLKHLSDFSREEAQEMMTSPEWNKAIFVRHPKPRVLSAFLDKAVVNSDNFEREFCPVYVTKGKGDLDTCIEKHQSFDFFLRNFTSLPYVNENMHWRSIYSRIDEKWWPFINFVGDMDNLNEDAKTLLSSIHSSVDGVSAWDRVGTSGWSDVYDNCDIAEQSPGSFLGIDNMNLHHKTNAREKMLKYYTPELERYVEERYADDLSNPYFRFSPIKLFPEEALGQAHSSEFDELD